MKKSVVLVLGIIIGVGISYFYFSGEQSKDVSDKENFVRPKGVISPSEAKILSQAFNTRHRLISDSIVKRPDNRSSWYSLSDMRNYLDYAENQAKELGYTMNGIRVYLGAHVLTKQGAGLTTMFFVPTGQKAVSEGSMLNISLIEDGDIPEGDGLNGGGPGVPPGANYPQQ
ncbi:hypothetical protein MNBD_BACTEROID02-890 [hydrothermal vent metagenome]|uniref:Uncharacterized protein n=1 Tax=hydrothermal vent metagenome TaxID=652676 RepID=A0A3B0QM97_9ZZZZ